MCPHWKSEIDGRRTKSNRIVKTWRLRSSRDRKIATLTNPVIAEKRWIDAYVSNGGHLKTRDN